MAIDEKFSLAVGLHRSGKTAEAESLYRQVLAAQPNHVEALHLLGVLASEVGRQDVAIDLIGRAVALSPRNAPAQYNLALAYARQGRLDQAMAGYQRTLELNPKLFQAWNNLGVCLNGAFQADGAIEAFRRAVTLRPDYATGFNNLANAAALIGKLNEAMACYDRAVALAPTDAHPASNRLYLLYFHPDYDAPAILREHQLWNERYAQPLRPAAAALVEDRSPQRRLRIGYVSPNFKRHSQAPFIVPLLSHHNPEQVELYCYTDLEIADAVTERIRAVASAWRPTSKMSDQAMADLIRSDRIDILVDLTMHMEAGRPLMFARKPAPIQIAWLAYPGTTGMPVMDYRLSDDRIDPPGISDGDYVEKSIRLPDTFACFDGEMTESGSRITDLPMAGNGCVTFGSLNNFRKMNTQLLRLWSGVLRAVESSRLHLLAPAGQAAKWIADTLGQLGVRADRIEFLPHLRPEQYLAELGRIDICLDTLPYNGHTTSLDALWMGVPVISRIGRTASGRAGASILHHLNLGQLAAADDDGFVKAAVELAGDAGRLAELRRTLRERMRASPLTDAARFAENVEAVYRRVWREWCGA